MKGQWESNINVWFPIMYSQKWNCYFQNQIRCSVFQFLHSYIYERFIYFQDPKSYTHTVYLWEIYIFPGSLCLFCYGKICGPTLRLYKSLTDTWMWKLGLRPRKSQKRNTWRGFLLQCKPHRPDCTLVTREKFISVTVTTSLRDLDHYGRWSTYDENVHKLSRVSYRWAIRAL